MSAFEDLRKAVEPAPSTEAALDALLSGLAQRVKATSNDQNVQKLSREMKIAAPGLVAAVIAARHADAS